jgi:hypothetical protein
MALSSLLNVSPLQFVAGGTISKNQVVKLDSTAGQVVENAAATDQAIGVALHDASAGDQVSVQVFGVAKCISDGTVTLHAQVEGAAGGKVTDAGGATAYSLGIALEAGDTDGDVVAVLLALPAVKRPPNS